GAALAVDRARIIAGGGEPRLERLDRRRAPVLRLAGQVGDRLAGIGGDGAEQLVGRRIWILRHAGAPLVEQRGCGVTALGEAEFGGAPVEIERVRRLAAVAVLGEFGEVVGGARRA